MSLRSTVHRIDLSGGGSSTFTWTVASKSRGRSNIRAMKGSKAAARVMLAHAENGKDAVDLSTSTI